MASPTCLVMLTPLILRAWARAWAKTGKSIAARIAIIAMTTSNSISVNARRCCVVRMAFPFFGDLPGECGLGKPGVFPHLRANAKPVSGLVDLVIILLGEFAGVAVGVGGHPLHVFVPGQHRLGSRRLGSRTEIPIGTPSDEENQQNHGAGHESRRRLLFYGGRVGAYCHRIISCVRETVRTVRIVSPAPTADASLLPRSWSRYGLAYDKLRLNDQVLSSLRCAIDT